VNLFIQESAEEDILYQVEWYAERGLPDIARRFRAASLAAIDALVAMPAAGPPRFVSNSRLAGLRTWPLKDFDEFRVYYLVQPELLTVVRILHDKRDVAAILGRQKLEKPL